MNIICPVVPSESTIPLQNLILDIESLSKPKNLKVKMVLNKTLTGFAQGVIGGNSEKVCNIKLYQRDVKEWRVV